MKLLFASYTLVCVRRWNKYTRLFISSHDLHAWAAQPGGVGVHCPPLLGPGGYRGTMKIAPPPLSGPGGTGGTTKMISLSINLCFCTSPKMAHIPLPSARFPSHFFFSFPPPLSFLPLPLHLPHLFLPIHTHPVPLPLEVGTLKSS